MSNKISSTTRRTIPVVDESKRRMDEKDGDEQYDDNNNDTTSSNVMEQLQDLLERRNVAYQNWVDARSKCATYFTKTETESMTGTNNNPYIIFELNEQRKQLQTRLHQLRKACNDHAITVCSLQVQNQLQQEYYNQEYNVVQYRTQQLERIQNSLTNQCMVYEIQSTRTRIQQLRFRWAIQSFHLHKLQVETPTTSAATTTETLNESSTDGTTTTKNNKPGAVVVVEGIGKIGGLPLPHKGLELFGILPPAVLQSALRLVASLTSTISRCLGIHLPHPILLQPSPIPPSPSMTTDGGGNAKRTSSRTSIVMHKNNCDIATICEYTDRKPSPVPTAKGGSYNPNAHVPNSRQYGIYNNNNSGNSSPNPEPSFAGGLSSILYNTGHRILKEVSHSVATATSAVTTAGTTAGATNNQHHYPSSTTYPNTAATNPSSFSMPSMDSDKVTERLLYSTAAIIAEDTTPASTLYALRLVPNSTPPVVRKDSSTSTATRSSSEADGTSSSVDPNHSIANTSDESFTIALQLLQNNIIALCIRAGVPIDKLHPAVAILLNLHELYLFCCSQATEKQQKQQPPPPPEEQDPQQAQEADTKSSNIL